MCRPPMALSHGKECDMADRFTTVEACKALGISRRTFIRWTQRLPIEREVAFTESGKQYLYTREALEHLMRQVRGDAALSAELAQPGAECTGGDTAQAAQGRQGVTDPPETGGDGVRQLALPPSPQLEEFMDLLADVRDVVARASAGEGRATAAVEEVATLREEVRQLREVLVARLPGPLAPSSPPPRVRWRVVFEVVALGVVCLLAGAMVAAVARVLQINGAIVLPW